MQGYHFSPHAHTLRVFCSAYDNKQLLPSTGQIPTQGTLESNGTVSFQRDTVWTLTGFLNSLVSNPKPANWVTCGLGEFFPLCVHDGLIYVCWGLVSSLRMGKWATISLEEHSSHWAQWAQLVNSAFHDTPVCSGPTGITQTWRMLRSTADRHKRGLREEYVIRRNITFGFIFGSH